MSEPVFHASGTFVAERPRKLDRLRADSAAAVVMDVGAAHAHGLDLKQHIAWAFEHGGRSFADGDLIDSSQQSAAHGIDPR